MNAATRLLRLELEWLADARHKGERELINNPRVPAWLIKAQICQIEREMAEIDFAIVVLGGTEASDPRQAELFT
jgi:hypothetical protein